MKALRRYAPAFALAAIAATLFFAVGHAADPKKAAAPVPVESAANPLVVHEWGTFTSFSGSDGVQVNFHPSNDDLPPFVYHQEGDPFTKSNRLYRDGTVSMETPVVYFYTDRETKAAVKVDFPQGWVTEWFPFATGKPARTGKGPAGMGQSIKWNVRLMPNEAVKFPRLPNDKNHYYAARETDAVPLEAELPQQDEDRDLVVRGGTLVQREKFLFYRGVGNFSVPVVVKAMGGGQVKVKNAGTAPLAGVVLVSVKEGKVGFAPLADLPPGAEGVASIPSPAGDKAALAALMVEKLTGTGLYAKEAQAMVKTWDSAWFGEDGLRVLYLVPRGRTDELLPITIEPKPAELVRVLLGRHDFLTPEQEAMADKQMARMKAAHQEIDAAEKDLRGLGRFTQEARQLAVKRLEAKATEQK